MQKLYPNYAPHDQDSAPLPYPVRCENDVPLHEMSDWSLKWNMCNDGLPDIPVLPIEDRIAVATEWLRRIPVPATSRDWVIRAHELAKTLYYNAHPDQIPAPITDNTRYVPDSLRREFTWRYLTRVAQIVTVPKSREYLYRFVWLCVNTSEDFRHVPYCPRIVMEAKHASREVVPRMQDEDQSNGLFDLYVAAKTSISQCSFFAMRAVITHGNRSISKHKTKGSVLHDYVCAVECESEHIEELWKEIVSLRD